MDPPYTAFPESMDMGTALHMLVELFEAKIDGDTSVCSSISDILAVPIDIDDAIRQGIGMIKNTWEFQGFCDLDGAFMQKWRDIEWTFENWEDQEVLPDKIWVREILQVYESGVPELY